MKGGFVWLDSYGFVYKRVMFIPYGEYGYILGESYWNEINSIIEGVL